VAKRSEAGPEARLVRQADDSVDYQVPLCGQPPWPELEQVRVSVPAVVSFVMTKFVLDFDFAVMV
jgi:hypothetical protein